jgi:hypothetical protein
MGLEKRCQRGRFLSPSALAQIGQKRTDTWPAAHFVSSCFVSATKCVEQFVLIICMAAAHLHTNSCADDNWRVQQATLADEQSTLFFQEAGGVDR